MRCRIVEQSIFDIARARYLVNGMLHRLWVDSVDVFVVRELSEIAKGQCAFPVDMVLAFWRTLQEVMKRTSTHDDTSVRKWESQVTLHSSRIGVRQSSAESM